MTHSVFKPLNGINLYLPKTRCCVKTRSSLKTLLQSFVLKPGFVIIPSVAKKLALDL